MVSKPAVTGAVAQLENLFYHIWASMTKSDDTISFDEGLLRCSVTHTRLDTAE